MNDDKSIQKRIVEQMEKISELNADLTNEISLSKKKNTLYAKEFPWYKDR